MSVANKRLMPDRPLAFFRVGRVRPKKVVYLESSYKNPPIKALHPTSSVNSMTPSIVPGYMSKDDIARFESVEEPVDAWNTKKNGYQRLACAVLQRAICDALMMNAESGTKRANTRINRRFKEEALRWMREPQVSGGYTFAYLCDIVGIDEEVVWRKIQEHEKKPTNAILALGIRKENKSLSK